MPNIRCTAVARAGVLLLASLAVGCAAGNKPKPVLDPQYYGTWIELGASSWWDFSATGAHLYLVSDREECQKMASVVVGRNRINVVAFQDGTVSMRRDGEDLVTNQAGESVRLLRASRSNICRRPSGKYLTGAPFGTDER